MKPIHATLIAMAGLLALMNSPLHAQETPPESQPETAAKPSDTTAPSRRDGKPDGDRSRGPRQVEEKLTPFIGVLTSNVPRELRVHFGLQEGFGLLVQEVMPDTPALVAGIKVDDILVAFEDQKLVNMEQLQTLVRSKKKDEQVTMKIISGGKETQVTVKIAERMMPVRNEDSRGKDRFFQPFGSPLFGSERGGPDMMGEMRESLERYQNQMREYQERMRDWNRDGSKGSLPPAPAWNGPERRERDRREGEGYRDGDRRPQGTRGDELHDSRETANVTRSDESGIYSLRKDGERTVFTAKPKEGQEQSWNLNNEEERRAIPEPMREKLKQLEEIRGSDKPREPRGGERHPGASDAPAGKEGI